MVYFQDVRVGQKIPPLRFDLTTPSMMAYGAATWDFHRYHYDGDFVRSLGQPAPFIDAQMLGALLARQLMDWAGPDAFLRRLSFHRNAMAYPGDRLICQGSVTGVRVEKGFHLVDCSLSIVTGDGREIVIGATAAIDLPSRD